MADRNQDFRSLVAGEVGVADERFEAEFKEDALKILRLFAAWVRPRDAWWPAFQLASGRLLVDALAEDGEPLANLNGLYQGSRG